jgi:hypothetical protein
LKHPVCCLVVVAALAAFGGAARAEQVTFLYHSAEGSALNQEPLGVSSRPVFYVDGIATLGVPITLPGLRIYAHSTPGASPVTLDDRFITGIGVRDGTYLEGHSFEFDGRLIGTLTEDSSTVRLLLPDEPVVARLGGFIYSVRAVSIDVPAPGFPEVAVPFEVTVTRVPGPIPEPPVQPTPEPSALALGAAGALGLAARGWLRRRRPRPN